MDGCGSHYAEKWRCRFDNPREMPAKTWPHFVPRNASPSRIPRRTDRPQLLSFVPHLRSIRIASPRRIPRDGSLPALQPSHPAIGTPARRAVVRRLLELLRTTPVGTTRASERHGVAYRANWVAIRPKLWLNGCTACACSQPRLG